MCPVPESPVAPASAGGTYENHRRTTLSQRTGRSLASLVHVMLEHPDDIGPNYALLLILADQLQLLRDAFEEDEIRRLRDEKLPQ